MHRGEHRTVISRQRGTGTQTAPAFFLTSGAPRSVRDPPSGGRGGGLPGRSARPRAASTCNPLARSELLPRRNSCSICARHRNRLLLAQGEAAEALTLGEAALETQENAPVQNQQQIMASIRVVADALEALDRNDEAAALRTRYGLRDGGKYGRLTAGDQSHQGPSQGLGVELVQQLLEGIFSCPAGHRHGLKIDRRLRYRACSPGAINLPPPRLRRGRPVLHDD